MDSDFMPQGGVPKEYYIPLGNGNRSRLKRVGEKKPAVEAGFNPIQEELEETGAYYFLAPTESAFEL